MFQLLSIASCNFIVHFREVFLCLLYKFSEESFVHVNVLLLNAAHTVVCLSSQTHNRQLSLLGFIFSFLF